MGIERIMIVDEAEANLLFFEMALKDLGQFTVTTATTGASALNVVQSSNIQLVIAAWEMQSMPGTVLVQRVRELVKKRHLPYLIYSKRMTTEDLALVKDLGLGDVLTLPLDRARAKEAIKAILDHEANLPPEESKLRKIENYLGDNKPTEALKLCDASLRKKGPFFARAQTATGEIWSLIGQLDKAEKALLEAIQHDPSYTEAHQKLAAIYSKMGRHEEAITALQKMMEHSPKNISTMLGLGSAYVDADRFDEAKAVFSQVADIDPDIMGYKDERGKLAFKEGDMPLATQLLAETQDGENIARYFNNLAIALTHKKDFDQAIVTYQKAIKVLGNRAKLNVLHYNLGLALAKKGELAPSFLELVKSYKIDPSFEKAYAAMARVGKEMNEKSIVYEKSLIAEVNKLRREHKAKLEAEEKSNQESAA